MYMYILKVNILRYEKEFFIVNASRLQKQDLSNTLSVNFYVFWTMVFGL